MRAPSPSFRNRLDNQSLLAVDAPEVPVGVEGYALPVEGDADGAGPAQRGAVRREFQHVYLLGVVPGAPEFAVDEKAARQAHRPYLFNEFGRKDPAADLAPLSVELYQLRPRGVADNLAAGALAVLVVMCEADIPATLAGHYPGAGTVFYSETDAFQMLQGAGIEDFDGTCHRPGREVGMRAVQALADYDSAVEMPYQPPVFLEPGGKRIAVAGVLGNLLVADSVEVFAVHGYTLFGLGSLERTDRLVALPVADEGR